MVYSVCNSRVREDNYTWYRVENFDTGCHLDENRQNRVIIASSYLCE